MLRRQTEAPILVHRLEAPLLRSGSISLPVGRTPLARLMMGAGAPFARRMRFAPIEPDISADDDLSLQPFGIDGRMGTGRIVPPLADMPEALAASEFRPGAQKAPGHARGPCNAM